MYFKTARPVKLGRREHYQLPKKCCVLVSDGRANSWPDNLAAILGFAIHEFSACTVLHTGALQVGNVILEKGHSAAAAKQYVESIESSLMLDMQERLKASPVASTCDVVFSSYASLPRERSRQKWRLVVKSRLQHEALFRKALIDSVMAFWYRFIGRMSGLEARIPDGLLLQAIEYIVLGQDHLLSTLHLNEQTLAHLKNSCHFLLDECADIGYWQGAILYPGELSSVLLDMMAYINNVEARHDDNKLSFVKIKIKDVDVQNANLVQAVFQYASTAATNNKMLKDQFLDTCVLQEGCLPSSYKAFTALGL